MEHKGKVTNSSLPNPQKGIFKCIRPLEASDSRGGLKHCHISLTKTMISEYFIFVTRIWFEKVLALALQVTNSLPDFLLHSINKSGY
jgi:hypothetical protein